MTEYRITEGPQSSGAHWDSMRPAGEHLAYELQFMESVLRCASGGGMLVDWSRIDMDESTDPADVAFEALEGWALSMDAARWVDRESYDHGLAKVVLVLGIGGPNVSLTFDCDRSGYVLRITLERYWSGNSHAWTDDPRACTMADDFLSLILPE